MMGLMTAPADPPDPAEEPSALRHRRDTDPGEPTDPSDPREPAQTIMSAEPVPLTGTQYYIQAGDYQACVTELGGGLRRLTYRDQPLITGYEPDELPPAGAGPAARTVAEPDRRRPVRVQRRDPSA